jgi:hypothetical protein
MINFNTHILPQYLCITLNPATKALNPHKNVPPVEPIKGIR